MNDCFTMMIEDQFDINNHGVVVTGVLQGTIRVGMPVSIRFSQGKIETVVANIEHYHTLCTELTASNDGPSCGIGVLLPLSNIFLKGSFVGYILTNQ